MNVKGPTKVAITDVREHIYRLNLFFHQLTYSANEEYVQREEFKPIDYLNGILSSFEILKSHEDNPVYSPDIWISCIKKEEAARIRPKDNEISNMKKIFNCDDSGNFTINKDGVGECCAVLARINDYTHCFDPKSFFTADGSFKLPIVDRKTGLTYYPNS